VPQLVAVPEEDLVLDAVAVLVAMEVGVRAADAEAVPVGDPVVVCVREAVAEHVATLTDEPAGHRPGQPHNMGAPEPVGQYEPAGHCTAVALHDPAGQ
jgi:hypothetical protein